jgi:hypothetical protein
MKSIENKILITVLITVCYNPLAGMITLKPYIAINNNSYDNITYDTTRVMTFDGSTARAAVSDTNKEFFFSYEGGLNIECNLTQRFSFEFGVGVSHISINKGYELFNLTHVRDYYYSLKFPVAFKISVDYFGGDNFISTGINNDFLLIAKRELNVRDSSVISQRSDNELKKGKNLIDFIEYEDLYRMDYILNLGHERRIFKNFIFLNVQYRQPLINRKKQNHTFIRSFGVSLGYKFKFWTI